MQCKGVLMLNCTSSLHYYKLLYVPENHKRDPLQIEALALIFSFLACGTLYYSCAPLSACVRAQIDVLGTGTVRYAVPVPVAVELVRRARRAVQHAT